MTWRVARSLEKLRSQVNARVPGRRKDSDGTIGDAAHASRSSDHNPWVRDGSVGVVTACDITHDPAGGCDAGILAEVLVASRDPRIKYIIWNRRIISSETQAWVWRKYSGSNPHNHHMHVSVKAERMFYDDTRDWAMPGAVTGVTPSAPPPPPAQPTLLLGSTGDLVRTLQKRLGVEADGLFGPATRKAVIAFQRKAGLAADGKVGPYTWAALDK